MPAGFRAIFSLIFLGMLFGLFFGEPATPWEQRVPALFLLLPALYYLWDGIELRDLDFRQEKPLSIFVDRAAGQDQEHSRENPL